MKKKIITAVLGICLTTTAFGGILTTQAGGLSSILGGAAKICLLYTSPSPRD